MRTTVRLDDDVAAAVERLRRGRSIGLSEAINGLIRAGLTVKRARASFRQRSQRIGLVGDADLAALTIGHGLTICSADTDFARLPEVRWVNPLSPGEPSR